MKRTSPAREPLRALTLIPLRELADLHGTRNAKPIRAMVERDETCPRPVRLGRRLMFRSRDSKAFLERNASAPVSA
jgi:hypothetical protein